MKKIINTALLLALVSMPAVAQDEPEVVSSVDQEVGTAQAAPVQDVDGENVEVIENEDAGEPAQTGGSFISVRRAAGGAGALLGGYIVYKGVNWLRQWRFDRNLWYAVQASNGVLVQELLDSGWRPADINALYQDALDIALDEGRACDNANTIVRVLSQREAQLADPVVGGYINRAIVAQSQPCLQAIFVTNQLAAQQCSAAWQFVVDPEVLNHEAALTLQRNNVRMPEGMNDTMLATATVMNQKRKKVEEDEATWLGILGIIGQVSQSYQQNFAFNMSAELQRLQASREGQRPLMQTGAPAAEDAAQSDTLALEDADQGTVVVEEADDQ